MSERDTRFRRGEPLRAAWGRVLPGGGWIFPADGWSVPHWEEETSIQPPVHRPVVLSVEPVSSGTGRGSRPRTLIMPSRISRARTRNASA